MSNYPQLTGLHITKSNSWIILPTFITDKLQLCHYSLHVFNLCAVSEYASLQALTVINTVSFFRDYRIPIIEFMATKQNSDLWDSVVIMKVVVVGSLSSHSHLQGLWFCSTIVRFFWTEQLKLKILNLSILSCPSLCFLRPFSFRFHFQHQTFPRHALQQSWSFNTRLDNHSSNYVKSHSFSSYTFMHVTERRDISILSLLMLANQYVANKDRGQCRQTDLPMAVSGMANSVFSVATRNRPWTDRPTPCRAKEGRGLQRINGKLRKQRWGLGWKCRPKQSKAGLLIVRVCVW